ncbi:hypothetical protein G6F59_018676 [Rhizopus arrhizus]|nr:hypothetical protein G6F59_018676 [Rhizopus arrhizus]
MEPQPAAVPAAAAPRVPQRAAGGTGFHLRHAGFRWWCAQSDRAVTAAGDGGAAGCDQRTGRHPAPAVCRG